MLWWRAARARASAKKRSNRRPLQVEQLESRFLLAASITPPSLPQLSSRPGAPATLYLDFDGNDRAIRGGRVY